MPEFRLFRVRVERPSQSSIFDEPTLPNSELIRQSIEQQPTTTTRKASVWALGNVERVGDDNAYSAALGRITHTTTDRYDEDRKAFTQEASEEAPNTWVLFDVSLQICAIAIKSALGNPIQLGNVLARLLSSSNPVQQRGLRITVSPIKDPQQFVWFIQHADRIVKFEVTFKQPNPFDVDKDFHEPLERLLGETAAQNGRTSISGDNLKKEPLEAISNSAAATGDDAKARLKLPESEKLVTKYLHNNPAAISSEDATTLNARQVLIEQMRALYRRIRGAAEP